MINIIPTPKSTEILSGALDLLGIAAVGGSIGVWAAMYTVRHKTKHMKFVIGVPVILAIQIGFVLYFILR